MQRFVDCPEENVADLQRVKQEDNTIRYIAYRHVSTIRVTYLLHYLVHFVRRTTLSVNSVSMQLPAAVRIFRHNAMSVNRRTSWQYSEQPAVCLSHTCTFAQTTSRQIRCYVLSLAHPKHNCVWYFICVTQCTVGKTEFNLLIARSILLNGIVNCCKTIEFSFCRTFHVSVFIVQYRCEGCVVEGISGWNGRHGGERVCAVFRRHETFCSFDMINWWSFSSNISAILTDLYRCKCTKYMVVWRDYPLQCQNNFIIFKSSH